MTYEYSKENTNAHLKCQKEHLWVFFVCFQWSFLHSQTAPNGSSGSQSIDTAVYQQGAAVTYNRERHDFSGPDGTSFKAQADTRVPSLPGAGAALVAAYRGGAAPGWYLIYLAYRSYYPYNLNNLKWTFSLSMCSYHFWGSDIGITGGAAASQSYANCSYHHSCCHNSHTGKVLFSALIPCSTSTITFFFLFKSSISPQVEIVGKPQPAAPSQPSTPGTEHELQQYRKSLRIQSHDQQSG